MWWWLLPLYYGTFLLAWLLFNKPPKDLVVVGHRGSGKGKAENTLFAFRGALDAGVRNVEFDVQLSKDGIPVVFHDVDLARCTNGTGILHENTLDQLRQLDAGLGEKIPTFSEENWRKKSRRFSNNRAEKTSEIPSRTSSVSIPPP